jgi:hypothetical protein
MYKLFFLDKDTYITDKIISAERRVSSSVGYASTIDLFKLYGMTSTMSGSSSIPNVELSRGLIHFDISELISLYQKKAIDITHSSFKAHVKLKDVYGGQTTPSNFNLVLAPLSRSFDEGFGKDIVYLSDIDTANFLSSSKIVGAWFLSVAAFGAPLGYVGGSDYFTTGVIGSKNLNFELTQSFKSGFEDLSLDVTPIISSTIAGILPDSGFRLSFENGQETDKFSYFVKRFASRHVYDKTLQPTLTIKFDDSVLDTTGAMNFNVSGSLFLYNYDQNGSANLLSSSIEISGSNCILLQLTTPISGGHYKSIFTGSQFSKGTYNLSGTYFANVIIPLSSELKQQLDYSGSVKFTPIWTSLDGSVTYVTGTDFEMKGPQTFTSPVGKKKYFISATGTPTQIKRSEKSLIRINIFDASDPLLKSIKFAINSPGKILRNLYYSLRDIDKNESIVPFDTLDNSTRISSDYQGHYFYLDGMSAIPNRTYVIDVLAVEANDQTIYRDVSSPFQIIDN